MADTANNTETIEYSDEDFRLWILSNIAYPANNTEVIEYLDEDNEETRSQKSYFADMDTKIKILNDEYVDITSSVVQEIRRNEGHDTLHIVRTVTFSVEGPIPGFPDVRDAILRTLSRIEWFEEEGKRLHYLLARRRLAMDEMVSKFMARTGTQGRDKFRMKLLEAIRIVKSSTDDIAVILIITAKRKTRCIEWLKLFALNGTMDEASAAKAQAAEREAIIAEANSMLGEAKTAKAEGDR